MKLEELRRGNSVLYLGAEAKVLGITREGKVIINNAIWDLDISMLSPMPITKSVLEKYGLEIHDLDSGYWGFDNCVGKYKDDDNLYFVVGAYDDGYGGFNYCTTEVAYEHELQNLYFFWNKEELQTK